MAQMLRMLAAEVAFAACAGMAALPEVSSEALAALGTTSGLPQLNGFVFIDGKYLPPPYTVSRRGNGIFINRIQVVQPVPWGGTSVQPEEAKKVLDDDGDFEVVEADGAAEEEKAADNDELLFGNAKTHAIDALFDDTTPPKKKEPERKPPPKPTQPATSAPLSKQQVDELKVKLDTLRKGYETALGRGDIYFFSERHSRVNGTYGTAKELFAVLPSAMRSAQSPQDLMAKLNQGGVFFLDSATCADLYKNRISFMQLDERRKQIEADEAAKRATTTGRQR